eukprot:XP_017453707.1 PREDICTED: olfactory receptor Olfr180-like [Rattus norvegicus]
MKNLIKDMNGWFYHKRQATTFLPNARNLVGDEVSYDGFNEGMSLRQKVGCLLRLTFCKSNRIDHFFCDILPLYRLSCTDPFINELMIYIFSMPIQVFTITTILVSYFCILFTIFKMKSKDGRGKAFSTCASHFFSVSIFYTCLLMYIRPFEEGNKDIPVAVFYTVIIPLLNPFIYSLRNAEVVNAAKKVMKTYNIFKNASASIAH